MAEPRLTPAERTQRARLAANARWAREPDRRKATEPGRSAARQRFMRQAEELHGPGTNPELLQKVAHNLEAEHLARMTFAASKANRKKSRNDGAPDQGAAVNDTRSTRSDVLPGT